MILRGLLQVKNRSKFLSIWLIKNSPLPLKLIHAIHDFIFKITSINILVEHYKYIAPSRCQISTGLAYPPATHMGPWVRSATYSWQLPGPHSADSRC